MRLILMFTILGSALLSSAAWALPDLSDKFIPSAVVKYCATTGSLPDSVTAKFDLLITNNGHNAVWAKAGRNSWQNLKTYNPDMTIVMYMMGPGEYNTASWGQMGQGWDWMKTNHGATAGAARWTGSGLKYDYLSNSNYPNERIMNLGHPDWQNYWYQTVYSDWWGGVDSLKYRGADGIFSDNTQYQVIWKGQWYDENHVGDAAYQDQPADYYSGGAYNDAKWRNDINAFFNRAVPGLAAEPQKVILVPNFGYMGSNPEYWAQLDTLAHPPFAAMQEGGFACPWSKAYSVWGWDNLVNGMKALKHTAVIMAQIGEVSHPTGLAAMDTALSEGNLGPNTTGWDALWFSIGSFLLALNPQKTNGYLSFSPTNYCENIWLDELDPKYLHLGAPLGDYYVQNGVAFREYEDGWAVVNKTYQQNKTGIPVPSGRARVITHANFKNTDAAALATSFNLNYYRGVVLLKEGRKIGNEDNPTAGLPPIGNPAGAALRGVCTLRIYDMLGRCLKTVKGEPQALRNSISAFEQGLPNGIYIWRTEGGEKPVTVKRLVIR